MAIVCKQVAQQDSSVSIRRQQQEPTVWCLRKRVFRALVGVALFTSLVCGIALLCVVLLPAPSPPPATTVPYARNLPIVTESLDWNSESNTWSNAKDELGIVSKKKWLAIPVVTSRHRLATPVPYVIISHTATDMCSTRNQCAVSVHLVQTFHIKSRGWSDIGYNFLVGGDGLIYEGCGWDVTGVHSYGYNYRSVGISFIGTFNTELPPRTQISAAQNLVQEGVRLGKIAENYKLLGHRQVSKTESPGSRLFQEMKAWPHWMETP